MDEGNALAEAGRVEVDAGKRDRTAVRLVDAGKDLDQRRLARTVGAEESVDLAATNREVDGAEGLGSAEALGEPADHKQWLVGAIRTACVRRSTHGCQSHCMGLNII